VEAGAGVADEDPGGQDAVQDLPPPGRRGVIAPSFGVSGGLGIGRYRVARGVGSEQRGGSVVGRSSELKFD
jgi:hypothetical protein